MLAVRTSFAPRLMRSFGFEIETYKANLNIRIETDCLGPVDLSEKTKGGGMKDPVILGSLQHQN